MPDGASIDPPAGAGQASSAIWRVLDSSYPLRDAWISVRADHCVTPAGAHLAPYYVIEYPDFVHALAVDPAGRIVMVRQYRHGAGVFSFELPGGIMDPGDADPAHAAVRELREETGYSGEGRLIATLSVDPAKLSNRLHLVLVTGAHPGTAAPEPTEDIDVVVLEQAEAVRLALTGGILNAAHVGMLFIGLSKLNPGLSS